MNCYDGMFQLNLNMKSCRMDSSALSVVNTRESLNLTESVPLHICVENLAYVSVKSLIFKMLKSEAKLSKKVTPT